ncbi:hypothetical protein GGF50DRAFT_117846 [Schizophyllum commune]
MPGWPPPIDSERLRLLTQVVWYYVRLRDQTARAIFLQGWVRTNEPGVHDLVAAVRTQWSQEEAAYYGRWYREGFFRVHLYPEGVPLDLAISRIQYALLALQLLVDSSSGRVLLLSLLSQLADIEERAQLTHWVSTVFEVELARFLTSACNRICLFERRQ